MKLLSLLVALLVVMAARPAEACKQAMRRNAVPVNDEARLLSDGKKQLEAGDFRLAAANAEELLKTAQLNSYEEIWAHRIAGLAYLALHEEQKALPHLQSATKDFPDQQFLKVKLGQAEVATGQTRAGKARLEALVSGQLLDADAWAALGTARLSSKDWNGAKKATEEALKLNPSHAGALELKALLAPTARLR